MLTAARPAISVYTRIQISRERAFISRVARVGEGGGRTVDWLRHKVTSPSRSSPSLISVQSVIAATTLAAVIIAWAILIQRDPPRGPTGSGLSTTTPSATNPGIFSRSTISATGVVRTTMVVKLASPLSELGLSVPALAAGIGGTGVGTRPVIHDLHVLADGESVGDLPTQLLSGRSATVNLPPGTQAVELDYQARGVAAETKPSSPPGRALVLVTPLRLSAGSALPRMIVLQGGGILNLGCWTTDGPPTACGKPSGGDEWEVRTRAGAGDVAVVAQVDLPDEPVG